MLATSNSVLQCLSSSKTTSHANRGHLLMRFIASQARDAQRGFCTLAYGSHVTVSNPVSPLLLSMLLCTLDVNGELDWSRNTVRAIYLLYWTYRYIHTFLEMRVDYVLQKWNN